MKFERKWFIENRIKSLLGKHSETLLVNLPTYFTAGILSVYLIAAPLMLDVYPGPAGLALFAIPVLISVALFLKKTWSFLLIRMCIYYVLALITLAVLETARGPDLHLGMQTWYIIMLVSMSAGTIMYLKFAESTKFHLTPLDLLIFLMILAFSVAPRQILPSSPVIYPSMFSLVIISYSTETALNQGTLRKNIVLFSCIVSSLIIVTKTALSLLS